MQGCAGVPQDGLIGPMTRGKDEVVTEGVCTMLETYLYS
jgi:hypothetical protein